LPSNLVMVESRRDGFEELNRVAPYDRLLPLGERPAQFRQGDILQLPDPLSGHSELLSKFFESFRFAAVQPESLEDNLALAVVQHLQKLAKFVAHVLFSKQLERRPRIFITDDFAKFGFFATKIRSNVISLGSCPIRLLWTIGVTYVGSLVPPE